MKIIRDSEAQVVAVTQFLGHDVYKIPDDGDDSVRLGAFAGKGCYGSFGVYGRLNVDNQKTIVESRHGSVLEHYNISMYFEGITRACSHEIVRHRAGFGYSQRSTRYTNEGNAAIVLEPFFAALPEGDPLLIEHITSCQQSIARYENQVFELIARNPLGKTGTDLRKWARGKARNLLPHALETQMTITGNLRAWRHFIEMRSAADAEAEIRRLTAHVMLELRIFAPFYFSDYTETLIDGIPEFTTPYRKV